jgi:hypothetical protein
MPLQEHTMSRFIAISALALALSTTAALAGGHPEPKPQPQPHPVKIYNHNSAHASARAQALAAAKASAWQQQSLQNSVRSSNRNVATGGNAASSATGGSATASNGGIYNRVEASAASATAGIGNNTAPCTRHFGVGAQVPLFGASIGVPLGVQSCEDILAAQAYDNCRGVVCRVAIANSNHVVNRAAVSAGEVVLVGQPGAIYMQPRGPVLRVRN